MLYLDLFGKYDITCTRAYMFCNFYLSVFWSVLVNAASNTSPNSKTKYQEKVWNLFKVNNEDIRGTSKFLNISMSMRLFWWIQLYLNLFQHLSFHNLFRLVHGEVQDEVNTCSSWCHKKHKVKRRTSFSWTCF